MQTDVLFYDLPSKFDTLGANLLQAVANNQPVAGGLRYAEALAQCQLDGSLESLKKIDRLLTSIRRDLVRQGQGQNELKAVDFRNFVLYVAFYAGEVAKGVADKTYQLTWQPSEAFVASYPAINTKSFYQLMALTVANRQAKPLFLLQHIGARLFASVQNAFVSPMDSDAVAESVFWAVNDWLVTYALLSKDGFVSQNELVNQSIVSQNVVHQSSVHQNALNQGNALKEGAIKDNAQKNHAKLEQAQPIQASSSQNPNMKMASQTAQTISQATNQDVIQTPVQTKAVEQMAQSPSTQRTLADSPKQTAQTSAKKPIQQSIQKPKPIPKKGTDIFVEVKSDLSALPACNDTQQANYQKAAAMIDRVEGLIALQMQDKDLAYQDVPVGEKAKVLRQNGIKLLLQVAKAGNTNAMIKLALCYFEGRGVPQDDEKGVQLIKMAAEKGDNRAQKLLSKLYYQGLGVNQNVNMGEMWLDKAAAGGHPEAKKIKSYMTQIQLMRDDYRTENQKDRQFIAGLSLAGVVLIFAIWMSVKFI